MGGLQLHYSQQHCLCKRQSDDGSSSDFISRLFHGCSDPGWRRQVTSCLTHLQEAWKHMALWLCRGASHVVWEVKTRLSSSGRVRGDGSGQRCHAMPHHPHRRWASQVKNNWFCHTIAAVLWWTGLGSEENLAGPKCWQQLHQHWHI